MTIIILVFQVRNVSKLPSDTWLEGDKLRIQTFVIPKPGPHQYTDYPTPLPRPPPEQTPIKKTAIKKHPQGHRDLAVPSAPTALGEPAGGSMNASSFPIRPLAGQGPCWVPHSNNKHSSHCKKLTGI